MDRTKVLHGPRIQTYGETNYLINLSFGQNQGIAWSSDSNLWGKPTTLRKNLNFGQNQGIAWSLDSNLWGNQLLNESKFWTEPRYCMVLGLKPMGKPTT